MDFNINLSIFKNEYLKKALYEAYTLCESFADIVYEPEYNAFDKAQQFAASINPAMRKIYNSQKQIEHLYSSDEQSELDKIPTSFISANTKKTIVRDLDPVGDIHEDSLGLTARELGVSRNEISKPIKQPKTNIAKKLKAFDLFS